MDVQDGPGPVPEESSSTAADSGAGSPSGEPAAPMTVEVDGTIRRLPAEHDFTGDGLADAALETPEGTVVVFADTEDNVTGAPGPDGRADEAYVVDKRTGQVIGTARLDRETGRWVEPGPESGGSS